MNRGIHASELNLPGFNYNASNLRFVSPAKAGVQSVKLFLRSRFEPWIPAFAGMTA